MTWYLKLHELRVPVQSTLSWLTKFEAWGQKGVERSKTPKISGMSQNEQIQMNGLR
jgi:hypothetical protein